jgi:ATP-dependent Clp protease ATP-binding subunit ClpA
MNEQPPTNHSPEPASQLSPGWRSVRASGAALQPGSPAGAPQRGTRATVHAGNSPAGNHATGRSGSRGPRPLSPSGRVHLNPDEDGGEAADLQRQLRAMIAGQEEAIKEIVGVYQMHQAGLNTPQRPIGTLLFMGPTGTGKTRIVEALAEALVGTSRAVIKVDCGEFQHSHEIAKLVGSPPGYLGHRETHPLLSQENLNQYWSDRVKVSFVLFDEIEKASDALWNLLLGILDRATLTLGDNRKVDFSDAMIFLTSNLGAKEMSSIMSPTLGFEAASGQPVAMSPEEAAGRIRRAALEAARRKFAPEFINRLDKMIVFRPLADNDLRRIVDIELGRLQDRILTCSATGGFVLRVTERARQRLLAEGVDPRYGARYLRRTIEKQIVQPLSRLVASGQISMGDLVEIDDAPGERLNFSLVGQDLTTQEMSEAAGPWVQPWLQLAAALGENAGPKPASLA